MSVTTGDVFITSVLVLGIVMILTAAFEFNSDQSPLIKKRPSDDMELSEVCITLLIGLLVCV